MKEIPLTQGQVAIIDDEDFDLVSQYKWHAQKQGDTYYAVTHFSTQGKRIYLKMHRLVMGAKPGEEVDHKHHNGCDNRKTELRLCNRFENQHNQKIRVGSSKYKGVYWKKRNRKWVAQIQSSNKNIYLGLFNEEKEAAKAYDKKATELFGEFASLNFP